MTEHKQIPSLRTNCEWARQFFTWLLPLWLLTGAAQAQIAYPWADSVVVFQPGEGQNFGQDPQYFPRNVLGPPDSTATPTVASSDPNEIVSLGLGGRIVLAFTDNWIVDGPGPDFTVFENAFIRQFGPKQGLPFAEPARVAVSKDGVQFVAFPFDSVTLKGLAGVTPTNGRADPTNPDSSGGDSFDLADVGLDTVRFVELVDVTAMIKNNPDHPYWDPTLSGFDLDAVVAVNSVPGVPTAVPQSSPPVRFAFQVFPNPVFRDRSAATAQIFLPRPAMLELVLFNLLGQRVRTLVQQPTSPGEHRWRISLQTLPPGLYFLRLNAGGQTVVRKLRVVR